METCAERRKRKLLALAKQKGGIETIAKDCGLSPAALDQVVKGVLLKARADGVRNEKSLGDNTARVIEERYSLERGWFDSDDMTATMTDEERLELAFSTIAEAVQKCDRSTRRALEPLLASLAAEPEDATNNSRTILRLLVTTRDRPPVPAQDQRRRSSSIVGETLGKLDLGGSSDGRSDRATAAGGGKK